MNLSAPEISLLAVTLLSSLALAVMWLGDRSRPYMLWWALAHAALPVVTLLAAELGSEPPPNHPIHLLLNVMMSVQTVCLIAGVISYRSPQPRPPLVGVSILALCALHYLVSELTDPNIARRMAALMTVAALLASAVMMWRMGRFERLAAIFFGTRGLTALVLPLLVRAHPQGPYEFAYTPSLTVLLATGTVLALLIAAYQRSLDRLRQQYRILELAQELTSRLQDVSDERDLAQRVLTVLSQRLNWSICVFMVESPTPERYLALATLGTDADTLTAGQELFVPTTGLVAEAIKTQRVRHASNLTVDPRVPSRFRDQQMNSWMPSLVAIPVTHDGQVLAVVLLRDTRSRELNAAELLMLESLGQVIGLSLTNARNLRELAHRANHDTLTGLGNRAALHDHLNERLNGADGETGTRCAVLLFDLDHFKQVNDALGHAVGDQLLRELAARLLRHLADGPARLFRLGGDEFVVIHPLADNHSPEVALALARSLAEVIAQPLQIGELSLRTPASIGVAIGPDHGADSHALLRCADVAMYHAKQNGTGVTLYERSVDAHKLEHLTLLSAVDEGLEKQQFELFYQPFIDLATGTIEGCEGLIRWRHPMLGLIGAAEFMPLVEATDLIRGLTHRVIDIAMRDAARWQRLGIDGRIAINLSVRNILDPGLPAYLLDSAARHDVAPGRIQLEITETILINDPTSAGAVLQQLADAGFTLALDDFGTGYSSLAYLTRFPIHTLKIDRSFVRNMLAHPQSRTIVESTIALARRLGLRVTAEGVEQQAEAELLRQLGCDFAQGYLFSRPVPEEQLIALWQRPAFTET